MPKEDIYWVHPASFTYRLDRPEKPLETLWTARKGWGYIKRRDLWIEKHCTLDELVHSGYEELKPADHQSVRICPYCRMFISDIPGSLVNKHLLQCKGGGENWLALEDAIIHGIRVRQYENKILALKLREQQEMEENEKRERFDRIREDAQTRQLSKDRKKRLRQETKEELKNR
ncbi:MAG: hypothetical protein HY912_03145 [Desulfomonile tiedjei]|uniref:Uncharacterized protein n=1 Tax=Desulfomonile tiedjei TaxID=2358 RepID=A0A9D6V0J7_9BACT|nr:hypothetical protein [Desulfomonile tiedjei]